MLKTVHQSGEFEETFFSDDVKRLVPELYKRWIAMLHLLKIRNDGLVKA